MGHFDRIEKGIMFDFFLFVQKITIYHPILSSNEQKVSGKLAAVYLLKGIPCSFSKVWLSPKNPLQRPPHACPFASACSALYPPCSLFAEILLHPLGTQEIPPLPRSNRQRFQCMPFIVFILIINLVKIPKHMLRIIILNKKIQSTNYILS